MLQQREKRKDNEGRGMSKRPISGWEEARLCLRDQSQDGKMLDMRGRDAIVRVMETGMNEFG